jgi:hypothetical protein
MTSSVSCVGLHNEFWSAGAPGKMTETFQDVSTVRKQQLQLYRRTHFLPADWQQVVSTGGKILTFRTYQGLIPSPSQNFLTVGAHEIRNSCLLIGTAVADQQRSRGFRKPCRTISIDTIGLECLAAYQSAEKKALWWSSTSQGKAH